MKTEKHREEGNKRNSQKKRKERKNEGEEESEGKEKRTKTEWYGQKNKLVPSIGEKQEEV